MRNAAFVLISAAVLVTGCATRREVLRADRAVLAEERAECQAARAYGNRREKREECAEKRDARGQLIEDRNAPR